MCETIVCFVALSFSPARVTFCSHFRVLRLFVAVVKLCSPNFPSDLFSVDVHSSPVPWIVKLVQAQIRRPCSPL